MDSLEILEGVPTQKSPSSNSVMTLQKAIDLGEYDPEYLATFPEWHTLTKHLQWQLLRKALKNRWTILAMNWAEVNNQPDFRLKPELKKALEGIQKQLDDLQIDEERLQIEFTKMSE